MENLFTNAFQTIGNVGGSALEQVFNEGELIMSGLLILGNPIMAHAQQTKTTTAGSISTESCSTENILTKKEGLLQDSIQAMKEKLRCPTNTLELEFVFTFSFSKPSVV